MRVRAHAPVALRRELRELGHERPVLVEQLLRPVALEPRLELRQMLRIRPHLRERHLVRAPRPLHRQPVHELRTRPALRRPQHDHRPARPLGAALDAGGALDRGDLLDGGVEHLGHPPVHRLRLVAVDPVDGVAVALQQRRQLVVADAREHRRVGDLVAVQVQDRQHRAVAGGVEELVRVPAGGERAGLRLAVADDAADEQVAGCRTRRRTRARASSRARRPRGSSPESPAPRVTGCRPGTRTAGTAAAAPPRPA